METTEVTVDLEDLRLILAHIDVTAPSVVKAGQVDQVRQAAIRLRIDSIRANMQYLSEHAALDRDRRRRQRAFEAVLKGEAIAANADRISDLNRRVSGA